MSISKQYKQSLAEREDNLCSHPLSLRSLPEADRMPDMLYFAYGSNMDADQMRERCSQARFVSRGCLPRWSFIINSRGYANVVPSEVETVHGVLWEVDAGDLLKLDVYEGTALGFYERRTFAELVGDNRRVEAEIYVSGDKSPGIPTPTYIGTVLKGAGCFGLPTPYLRDLALSWSAQANLLPGRVE